jgi:hypothetical protein
MSFGKRIRSSFGKTTRVRACLQGMPFVTLYQAALAAERCARDPAAKAACTQAIDGMA